MDQIVPLSTAPNQSVSIDVIVSGVSLVFNLVIRFNEMIGYWVMDVLDSGANIILSDIPLLTGVYPAANILGQYQYLQIGSAYVLDVSNDSTRDYPDNSDLGTDFVLLWSDNV